MTSYASADVPLTAKYIWASVTGLERNAYAMFRRSFELDSVPEHAELTLFADTRYRLFVNGELVGHGPCRFFAREPHVDRWSVGKLLRPGKNVIAVMVNGYATSSFHSEYNRGGLIAWLTAEPKSHDPLLVSDENWKATLSPGHFGGTERMTFALNPSEQIDFRDMPEGWEHIEFSDDAWPGAIPVPDPERHWGTLTERPVPQLDESPTDTPVLLSRWKFSPIEDEDVYHTAVAARASFDAMNWNEAWIRFFIHSPRQQEVTLGMTPTDLYCCGGKVEGEDHPEMWPHLRQNYTVNLREGWNELGVWLGMPTDRLDFRVALPRAAGLTFSAAPDLSNPRPGFEIAGPWHKFELDAVGRPELPIADFDKLPGRLKAVGRTIVDAGGGVANPAVERSWMRVEPLADGAELASENSISFLFDFGGEMLVRPRVEFEAAEGTQIDLAYTERLEEDGSARLHQRSHVNMVERATARAGMQTWHAMHPRGFRYLELRVSGDLSRFKLHKVDGTGAYYPMRKDTTFECSDPRLTRIWELGRQALFACAEDNYLDCPWRERGVYVGDALVSWDVDSAVHGDPALLRWTIDLFLDGQGDAGLIRPGAHVLNPGRHPDYSTILLQAAKRYIEVTGDKSVLTNRPDQWRLLVEALLKLKVDSGLYDGEPLFPYIDISQHRNREPLACAFNCFIYKAMADGAWLFEQIGDSAWAKTCQEAADDLRPRIIEHYWDDQQGVFTDLPRETGEKDTSVHSNTLALLYGVADEAHTKHAWQWLREAAKDNFFGEPGPPARDAERVNAYFSYYLLDLMRHMGEYDLAVWYIGRCWGYMLDHGAWTTWESFGGDPGGSLCHVWGASPTWLLTRSVLGVDLDAATRGENVALEPHDAGLEWARGVVPHAKGRLEVSWRKTDAGFEVEATAPEGVEVSLAPGVEGTLKR